MAARRFTRPGPEARSAELVERAAARAKQGDTDALHFLYVRFVDEVGAFVHGMVRDVEVESATEAVFAKLVAEIQHYEPGELPFATWILRFAETSVSSKQLTRRQNAADRPALADAGNDPEHGRSPSPHDALRRLPDDQRRVLVLRYIAGLSTREIAERLGTSARSVRELDENGRRALQAAARLDAAAARAE